MKECGAKHIIRTQYVVPMDIISLKMNLPDAASMKLSEKVCDLRSESRLANIVRFNGGKGMIKRIMEEAAFKAEQSNRMFCNDGRGLIATMLDSVF